MWKVNEVYGNVELKVQTIGLANILHDRVSYHSLLRGTERVGGWMENCLFYFNKID